VSAPLAPVAADDPAYARMARREAAYWARSTAGVLETAELGLPSPVDRYTNRRFTGDESIAWYEALPRYGDFRRGLVLGTSAMGQDACILETNPGLHLTFCDISPASLERWQRDLGAKFPGRVQTKVVDLNFASFEPAAYDLIVSSSTLHHVMNLESLAGEIDRALRPQGLFFLQDYVGETRFRFDRRKKCIFEALYDRDVARRPGHRPGLRWLNEDDGARSPFCGIRSGDILRVLSERLECIDLHTAGAIAGLMLYAQPLHRPPIFQRLARRFSRIAGRPGAIAPAPPVDDAFLRELLAVDEAVCDADVLLPYNAFAVYRGRDHDA